MTHRLLLWLILFTTASRLHAQLSGVYGVGASGDYNTLQEALDDLKLQGASGDVVFELENKHSEASAVSINENTVDPGFQLTIRPQAGADTVQFTEQFNILAPNENIIIDGRPGGIGYRKALFFTYSNGYNLYYSTSATDDTVRNSEVKFCNFRFSRNGGIYCERTLNLKISDNDLEFKETASSFYIYAIASWLSGSLTVSKNKIYGSFSSNSGTLDKRFYGIHINTQAYSQNNNFHVNNNSLYLFVDASVRYASGVRVEGTSLAGVKDTLFLAHNSFLIDGTYNNNSGGRISLLDNVLVNRTVDLSGGNGNLTDNFGYGSSNAQHAKNLVYVSSGNLYGAGITWYKTDLDPTFEEQEKAKRWAMPSI